MLAGPWGECSGIVQAPAGLKSALLCGILASATGGKGPRAGSRERLTSRQEEQVRQLASFGAARTKTDRPIDAPLLSARHFRAALGSLASVELILARGGPHL
ncbi:hypothetical protein Celaphus_00014524 [Cervus elaphus hippelaphus]|uniref:Uncharacterized protein n=1 Tax=Cervus elaphus hippelaphus TaxID=46360 RepID=A0A212D4P7_CEREH|nr:hypothetical protein Celaphus_00014524 [Cervus elaphus hippelaphus]